MALVLHKIYWQKLLFLYFEFFTEAAKEFLITIHLTHLYISNVFFTTLLGTT